MRIRESYLYGIEILFINFFRRESAWIYIYIHVLIHDYTDKYSVECIQ